MKPIFVLCLAATACGTVADADLDAASFDAAVIDALPDAISEPDAPAVCTPSPAPLALGDPQGGFSAQKTVAVVVTPIAGDVIVESIDLTGIGLSTGTYTLGARIYDVSTQQLVATSADFVQAGPQVDFTASFDITATLSAGVTYALAVFTGGGDAAATAVVRVDEPQPFDDNTGAFRIEGARLTINNDAFPQLVSDNLPQITVHSCPATSANR